MLGDAVKAVNIESVAAPGLVRGLTNGESVEERHVFAVSWDLQISSDPTTKARLMYSK